MKRTITVATFVIVFATLLVLGIARAKNAHAYASRKIAASLDDGLDKPCSNATLNGTFGYTNTGFIVAPPALAGPFAGVGIQNFDGQGNTTASATVSQNGNILRVTVTGGTYTVNSDCTGSMTFLISPVNVTTHVDFVIVRGGAEFRAINTGSGAAITTVGKKQFPKDKE